MNRILLVLLLVSFGCSPFKVLNEKIFEAQKQHLSNSPYKSAKYHINEIVAQKSLRAKEIPKVINLKKLNYYKSPDTLVFIEVFPEICSGCPAAGTIIFYQDTLYSLSEFSKANKVGYFHKKEKFDSELIDKETENYKFIFERSIINLIRQKKNWMADPLRYGTEDCFGGASDLITVIYPNQKIEVIYVRCSDYEPKN